MARWTLFCLAPTWTQGTRVAFATMCVALAAGCNFQHYEESPTLGESACTNTWAPAPGLLPVAHWTFDGDDSTWLQQVGDGGASLQSNSGASRDSTTRLNGTDNTSSSLFLDGNQDAFVSGPITLPTNGFTWSIWISLEHKWKTLMDPQNDAGTDDVVWPILSTFADKCEGFRLEIRWTPGQASPSLVFLQSAKGDVGCTLENRVEYSLGQASWAWRAGIWHHVAVAYSPSSNVTTARLYWDDHLVSVSNFASTPNFDASTVLRFVNLGANGENAPRFRGNIDELALFDRPLEESDIANYALGSTTIAGPSGCRWRATEQRDEDAGISTVELFGVNEKQQIQATIHDEEWGGGLISAWLGPSRDLSHYAEIRLHASIPETSTFNGDLEFGLHAGDDSCTWYVDANPADALKWYTIDLANPGYCQTNPREHCAFPLDKVEWASLGSPTEHPVSVVKSRLVYAIDQLQLVPLDTGSAPLEIGGKVGPNNWCWRTEAFQVVNLAQAQNLAVDSGVVSASLCGRTSSTPALVVDFGDDTIDLSSFADLSIGLDNSTTISPELTLQDRHGSWLNWSPPSLSQNQTLVYSLDRSKAISSDGQPAAEPEYNTNNWKFIPWKVPPELTSITRIKFQKNFGTLVQYTAPATLAISSVMPSN